MTADGTFANHDTTFASFLWNEAAAPTPASHSSAFVARNFLLDERVPAVRADSYLERGIPRSRREWTMLHRIYEAERLRRPPHNGVLPRPSQTVEASEVPETFEVRPIADPFDHISADLHLVRIEPVGRLAEASGTDAFDLVTRLEQYVSDTVSSPSDSLWLLGILDAYASAQLLRPVFAGFAEDVRDILTSPTATSHSTLARLRDRFGLLHYDPADTGPIPLAVFRYPVEAVPEIEGVSGIVLNSPTVLESGQSSAFCPCPAGSQFGTAVDLSPSSRSPAREAVHLPFRYSPDHLAVAGLLEDPVVGTLAEFRRRHLQALRSLGASGYAQATDSDVLDPDHEGQP